MFDLVHLRKQDLEPCAQRNERVVGKVMVVEYLIVYSQNVHLLN